MTTTELWRRTTLGEVAGEEGALQTGPFGNQLGASDYVADGIPVVMPQDLIDGEIATKKIARVRPEKASELPRYRLQAGDILLARRGEMGRCAMVRPTEEGWICGTGCLRIRPNERIDNRFLTHYLGWPTTVAWLTAQAVGQTLPSLNTGILAKIPLTLPSLEEQRRIAEALEEVDRAILQAQAVVDHIVRIRDGFLKSILHRQFDPYEEARHERPTSDPLEASGNHVDTEVLGSTSTVWPRRSIGSLCKLSNGFAFKTKDRSAKGLPIIRIQNLNGSDDFNFFAGPPKPGWVVETGDLLFAWAGVKGSSFGPRIWRGPRGVLNQHIFRVQPGEGVVKEWLFEALRLATHEIEERAQGFKTSLLHVRKADVTEHPVTLPPIAVQRWIAERSTELGELEYAERSTLESMVRIKRGLMQDLFSGRIRTVRA